MKVKFSFKIPEDNEELKIHYHSHQYYCVLAEIIMLLKQKLDYDVDGGRYTQEQVKALEDFSTEFYEELARRGLSSHFE